MNHALVWGIPLMSEEPLTELSDVLSRPEFDKYVSREDGEAQMILTGDQDLLELDPFHGVEILAPADFLVRPVD